LFSCACDEAPNPSRAGDATDIDDASDHDHDDDNAPRSQSACDLLSSRASSTARARACDQEITVVSGPSDLTRSIAISVCLRIRHDTRECDAGVVERQRGWTASVVVLVCLHNHSRQPAENTSRPEHPALLKDQGEARREDRRQLRVRVVP
jgi:hypothetical protein